jgi:hypothetical protein
MSAGPVEPAGGPPPDLARWQRGAFLAGGVGLVVCAVAALAGWRQEVFRTYLVAFNLCLGVGVGSLVILMLQYLTGGTWGLVLRRPLEAATRTLPLMAVLFVPVALGASDLYPWAVSDPEKTYAHDEPMKRQIEHLRPFLNMGFFVARAAVYFVIWAGLGWLLSTWSRRHDETGDERFEARARAISGPGLVVLAIAVTFASIDWVMSLEPKWYSTIYGAMFGMGQVLSAFSFCVAVLVLLGTAPPLGPVLNRGVLRDLGSLMLAFVMVWAYLSFSQYLLIWSGNLPEEVPWYKSRFDGGWKYVGLALVLFHFALPFVLLLMADVKRNRRALTVVALVVFGMRLVDLSWLILPAFRDDEGHSHPLADYLFSISAPIGLCALAGVGGLWLGTFLWQLRARPLLPLHMPAAEEGEHHG